MRRMWLLFLGILVGLLLLVACAKAEPTPTPRPPTATAIPPTSTPLPPGVTPTATPPPTPVPTPILMPVGIPTAVIPPGKAEVVLSYTPAPLLPPKPGVYKTYEEAMADWPKVVAAAKKEGKVSLIATARTPGTWLYEVEEAFKKKYGIDIEFGAGGRIGDILPKLSAEKATGKYTLDTWPTGPSFTRQTCAAGFCEPFAVPSALEPGQKWILDPLAEGPHRGTGGTLYLWQVNRPFINTDLVPQDKWPRKHWDLADPWWKGKLAIEDPRGYGPISDYVGYVVMVPGYGWPLIEALFANAGKLYSSHTVARPEVAKGAFAASPMNPTSGGETLAKLPKPWNWKFVPQEDGDMGWMLSTIIIKNGPHPNAARLYADFLTSREADAIRGKFWGVGVARRDTPHITPEEVFPQKLFPVDYGSVEVTIDVLPKLITERVGPYLKTLGF